MAPNLRDAAEGLAISALLLNGSHDQARDRFEKWKPELAARAASGRVRTTHPFGFAAVAIAELANKDLLNTCYSAVCASPMRVFHMVSADWVRGLFAFRLDLIDEADQHFRNGLEWCERERCPVEAGRCHQGLAEIEEQRGNLEGVRERLDAAGALFSQYGAKLYLDQVIAKKQILNA